MFCPNCGKENIDTAHYCQACGTPFVQKPETGSAAARTGDYAGFWTRFVAVLVDALVLLVGTGILTAITAGSGALLSLAGPWLYEAFMLSSPWQATVGKRAMSIMVVGADGRRLSFARASGRHFAKYVSGLILGIGFIMAAFTARRQALHDMIAETVVINGR